MSDFKAGGACSAGREKEGKGRQKKGKECRVEGTGIPGVDPIFKFSYVLCYTGGCLTTREPGRSGNTSTGLNAVYWYSFWTDF